MLEEVTSLNSPAERFNEETLIRRVREGEHELFYELIRPYERRVYSAAFAILRNEADAEDAAQEAMLKAFKHIGQFRAEARFSTWLIQITVNEARMRRRKEHARLIEPIIDHEDAEGNYIPRDFADWREIPSETLERKEIREKLAEALESLGQIYRDVFVLRDMQHLSIDETAKALGISTASVKTRLLRARLMFRDLLAPGLGGVLEHKIAVREGDQAMVVNCEQVWQEISNYLEDDVDPNLRVAMEAHFRECDRCRSVLEGTRNVIQFYGDERMIDVPLGFGHRLQRRLEETSSPAGVVFWVGWSRPQPPLWSQAVSNSADLPFSANRTYVRNTPSLGTASRPT